MSQRRGGGRCTSTPTNCGIAANEVEADGFAERRGIPLTAGATSSHVTPEGLRAPGARPTGRESVEDDVLGALAAGRERHMQANY